MMLGVEQGEKHMLPCVCFGYGLIGAENQSETSKQIKNLMMS
jgi:hypothetical protein